MVLATTCLSKLTKSAAPVEPRRRIVDTWPLSWRISLSVNVFAVRTMIGMFLVDGCARNASTTSNPVTFGIIRQNWAKFRTRGGRLCDGGSEVQPASAGGRRGEGQLELAVGPGKVASGLEDLGVNRVVAGGASLAWFLP